MAKNFGDFSYLTFDVVGTLIDFEGGLTDCLSAIASEAGVPFDGEEALAHYRTARYMPDVQHFPDDLARVYGVIAPEARPARQRSLWQAAARLRAELAPVSR